MALGFLAPGVPNKARYMALELVPKLPKGAKATLEMPMNLYELLHERHQLGGAVIDRSRNTVQIPINPHGRTRFGEVLFPAKSRASLRILVHLPPKNRKETYTIVARQLWEMEEVGRVTSQLRPN